MVIQIKGAEKLDDTTIAKEFSVYLEWAQKVCAANSIIINDGITQIENKTHFCIPSDIGDLYLKKMGNFINDELKFVLKLMELRIITLPELVGYDHDMNICLMRDMGGSDLSLIPQLNMETALDMFVSLSRIQKGSIEFVKTEGVYGFDYRISTMLKELKDLPELAYKMLSETPYSITRDETEKLKQHTEHVTNVLESVKNACIPDTIHHGDLGTYNVRVVDGESIFYDWGCGGVSHPFFDTFRLLYSIKGKLPTDIPAKEKIIDTYVREWIDYGSYEEVNNIFTAIDGLAGFYMAYVKFIRARNEHLLYAGKTDEIPAAAGWLNNRYEISSIYLKRFLENNFD